MELRNLRTMNVHSPNTGDVGNLNTRRPTVSPESKRGTEADRESFEQVRY